MSNAREFVSHLQDILAQYPFEVIGVRIQQEDLVEVLYKTYTRADSVTKLIPSNSDNKKRALDAAQQIVHYIKRDIYDKFTLNGRDIIVTLDGPIHAECQACATRCEYPAPTLAQAARMESYGPLVNADWNDREVLYNMFRSLNSIQRLSMKLMLVGGVLKDCPEHCPGSQPKGLSD